MPVIQRCPVAAAIAAAVLCGTSTAAPPAFAFSDNFDAGPSPYWSNLRGDWVGHDGVYDANSPTNAPPTHTSLPWSLGDLTLDVDVRALSDGGVWLHADAQAANGVLLVTGGGGWGSGNRDSQSGNSLYFHVIHNNSYSDPVGKVFPGITPGENDHLRVTVVGDTYSVYLNNNPVPVTTLVTSDFPMGRVGLYDYSSIQAFDNFSLTSATLPGDANLNGVIDPDDYALTDRGLAKGLAGWGNGDFNDDGHVTGDDYLLIDTSLARQGSFPAGLLSARESQFGTGYVAELLAVLPEPASATLWLTVAPFLAARRRVR